MNTTGEPLQRSFNLHPFAHSLPAMAPAGFNSCDPQHLVRLSPVYSVNSVPVRPTYSTSSFPTKSRKGLTLHEDILQYSSSETDQWKKFSSKDLGVSTSAITKPTRLVLTKLKDKGHEVYLVGGCVRDLILRRIPKDFDITTSAQLKEVQRSFPRCEIVGKRFPICLVHVDDTVVEVSSFSTTAKGSQKNLKIFSRQAPRCSKPDYIRWKNCLQRDFTINGLLFDPFSLVIYDYIGGIEDINKSKVRTVIPAESSFAEDCARILRAVRIAARLGFRFTKETARCIREQSCSVLRLDKGRILMEMNHMFAFGSAEASLRLLWKFGLLEILLPIQAAYFVSQGFRRRDKRSNMLLSLFSSLDVLLAPDRPCTPCLWVSLLAFHKALVDKPRDPVVVAAFCLAVYNGGHIREAVCLAKNVHQPYDSSFHELIEAPPPELERNVVDEVVALADSVKHAVQRLNDEQYVSQAMAKYPQAPYSDLVFMSTTMQIRVSEIVNCVKRGRKARRSGQKKEAGRKIDYELLGQGNVEQLRYVFARVIFDTVYPPQED